MITSRILGQYQDLVIHFINKFQPGSGNGSHFYLKGRWATWANWAACATGGDDLFCEYLCFTLVPYLYCRPVCFKIIIMSACIRDYQHQNVLGLRNPAIPRLPRDEVKFYRSATRHT